MDRRDSVMDGTRIVVCVGPVHLPDRATLLAALAELVRCDPSRRLAQLSDGHGRWIVPDERRLSARIEEMIVDAEELSGMPPADAAVAARRIADPRSPVTFITAVDRIILVADHRLCDGLLASNLIGFLLAAAAGSEMPSMLTARDTPFPLVGALRETFARRGAIRTLLRQKRTTPDPLPPAALPAPSATALEDSGPVLDCATAVIDRATFRAVRTRMREQHVSLAAIELSLWRGALEAAGIATGSAVTLVVDLRRYLPRGARVLGNFVTGLPLEAAGHAVEEIEKRLEGALKAARPLAAFASGMVRGAMLPPRTDGRASDSAHPAHAVVSSVGQIRGLESLPWAAAPDERTVLGCVDVGHPHEITFVTMLVAGALHVTATFDSRRHRRADVERALALAAGNAVDFVV